MNPVIIVVCLLVVAFVAFFIAYSEEKRSAKKDNNQVQSFVDDPSVLFEADSKSKKEDEDIEII
ncbi:MAG: hypothetical protein SOU84_06190 [Candidatus Faecimonas sp.]|nr:hypothetical protein [Mycoplasmatota bacterium]MDY2908725.1 hypothetical protein [Candidatus Faecimonas sp.]